MQRAIAQQLVFFQFVFIHGGCRYRYKFFLFRLFLLAQVLAFDNRVRHLADNQFDGANSIVVGRNDVIHVGGVAIGIHHRHHGDVEQVGFMQGSLFSADIHNEHQVGKAVHIPDTAQTHFQFLHLAGEQQGFFFRQFLEIALIAHAFQAFQFIDALTNGVPVGEHTAQPAGSHIGHATTRGFGLDGILGLALGTYEKNGSPISDHITHNTIGRIQRLDGLLQINDVDVITFRKNVRFHLRVPLVGAMPKVHPTLEERFHRNNRHFKLLCVIPPFPSPLRGTGCLQHAPASRETCVMGWCRTKPARYTISPASWQERKAVYHEGTDSSRKKRLSHFPHPLCK